MSVLYRSIWSSEVSDSERALVGLREQVAAWVQDSESPDPLPEGKSNFEVSQRRHREAVLRTVNVDAFEVISTDRSDEDPTEWVTEIRVVVGEDSRVHTLVQLSMSSDDLARRVEVGRPAVVHSLLSASKRPALGVSQIVGGPQEIPEKGVSILCEILANPDRTLPVVVCAAPDVSHGGRWLHNAEIIAKRVEGVALVVTLDRPAVDALKNELGRLAIWNGGVRVYVPGVVNRSSGGWLHRYYRGNLFERRSRTAINSVVYHVTQLSARRRVPDVFRVFGERSGLPLEALEEMVPAKTVAEERERWEFEIECAREDQSSAERSLGEANNHLSRIRDALFERGMVDLYWGAKYPQREEFPDDVQCVSEAVLAAQMYLSDWISLPESTARELDDIDTAPSAYSWGNRCLRGLRALAAYAQDRAGGWDSGGFWEWCDSGVPFAWPATDKKLSMVESKFVCTNDKFRRARIFPVDERVDSTGEILMLSHLKISEGGGNLAPRVYFYDDTKGSTKKVHVGFVGPHYLVPNKSTN